MAMPIIKKVLTRVLSYDSQNIAESNNLIKIGSFELPNQGDILIMNIYGGQGQNGHSYQNTAIRIFIKKAWENDLAQTFGTTVEQFQNSIPGLQVWVMSTSSTKGDIYIKFPYEYPGFHYIVEGNYKNYTHLCTQLGNTTPKTGTSNEVTIRSYMSIASNDNNFILLKEQVINQSITLNAYQGLYIGPYKIEQIEGYTFIGTVNGYGNGMIGLMVSSNGWVFNSNNSTATWSGVTILNMYMKNL